MNKGARWKTSREAGLFAKSASLLVFHRFLRIGDERQKKKATSSDKVHMQQQ